MVDFAVSVLKSFMSLALNLNSSSGQGSSPFGLESISANFSAVRFRSFRIVEVVWQWHGRVAGFGVPDCHL